MSRLMSKLVDCVQKRWLRFIQSRTIKSQVKAFLGLNRPVYAVVPIRTRHR